MSELESVTIYYLKFTVKMSWVYHYLIHISETWFEINKEMDQAFVFWVGWKGQALPSQRKRVKLLHINIDYERDPH